MTNLYGRPTQVTNPYTQRIVSFTTPGANSWVVPTGVTGVLIRKLGGGGGGGGANANGGNGAPGYAELEYWQAT